MEKKIEMCILRRIVYRKYNKRPKELKYLWIGKETGYSYQQVRNVIDRMILQKKITKYHAWIIDSHGRYRRRNFYTVFRSPSSPSA